MKEKKKIIFFLDREKTSQNDFWLFWRGFFLREKGEKKFIFHTELMRDIYKILTTHVCPIVYIY